MPLERGLCQFVGIVDAPVDVVRGRTTRDHR